MNRAKNASAVLTLLLIPVAFVVLYVTAWSAPYEPRTDRVTTPASSAAIPQCITEDGAGMALCLWDATSQGNGKGRSGISGDCDPSIMGTPESIACVALHKVPSHTVTDADGFEVTMPNGADLVAECTDENRAMTESEKAENGFSLFECFRAQMP